MYGLIDEQMEGCIHEGAHLLTNIRKPMFDKGSTQLQTTIDEKQRRENRTWNVRFKQESEEASTC